MTIGTVVLMQSEQGRKLVHKKCEENNVDISTFEKLIEFELDQVGKLRKRGLFSSFDEVLSLDCDNEEG